MPPGSEIKAATAADSSLRYIPGLDVLRGLAIAMVLIYHGVAEHELAFHYLPANAASVLHYTLYRGYRGVHLFFVLSGFLITGILMESRTRPDYFLNFYRRRILRIVPAYVAMLTLLVLSRSITWRYLVVCLLYFCNMPGLFGVGAQYSPLWSLSVEEQFYLVWPLVVRHLSLRRLFLLSLALIVLTPGLRLALLYAPLPWRDIHYKTWALLDFFAAGSALAISIRTPRFRTHLAKAVLPLIGAAILLGVLLILLRFSTTPFLQNLLQAISDCPWVLAFSGLVLLGYLWPRMAAGPFARPFIFLARISYGLYLYHLFFFDLIARHWPTAPAASLSPLTQELAQYAVQIVVSIAIAWISRNTLEEFFLRLKPKHQPA